MCAALRRHLEISCYLPLGYNHYGTLDNIRELQSLGWINPVAIDTMAWSSISGRQDSAGQIIGCKLQSGPLEYLLTRTMAMMIVVMMIMVLDDDYDDD